MTTGEKRGVSRRAFLATTGIAGVGLVLGFRLPGVRELVGWGGEAASPFGPNAWLSIMADGRVTIMVDEMEMGQGVMTAMPMIVAEELDVAWEAVSIEYGPLDPSSWPRGISTGGSTSTRTGWDPLRTVGAQAREMLKEAAAQQWEVSAAECTTRDGTVFHAASSREVGYGDLVELAATLPVPEEPPFKDPSEYRILGRRIPRVDTPAKVDGSKVFGYDLKVPGGRVAVLERSPVFGGTLTGYDGAGAEASPGVRSVVQISNGVAVVADDTWSALKGREQLSTEWDEGALASLSTESLDARLRELAEGEAAEARSDGNVAGALSGAAQRLEAEYQVPYLAHATMEPMNCTAWVKDDGTVEVWAPTQAATASQQTAAEAAGVAVDRVTIHSIPMGGGFGRRSHTDFVREAVEVSKAVGEPVKLMWTREDDMRGGQYRPTALHRFRAGLGSDGMPVAWEHRVVAPSIFYQFGPGALDRANGVDGDAVSGARQLPYEIPNVHVDYVRLDVEVPLWFWRSVGHSHNGFTTEAFIDELAHAAGADPMEYRARLLQDHARNLGALERVAEAANWGSTLPEGMARGIAVHESFGTFIGQVVEVSMDRGRLKVHKVYVAVDCGQTINPDTIEAQMDSNVAYGLSAALWGKLDFAKGRVVQSNFHDYNVVRMGDMPKVETHIIQSSERPGGIGEPGLPPFAGALTNAVFALTGKRIRQLPIGEQLADV